MSLEIVEHQRKRKSRRKTAYLVGLRRCPMCASNLTHLAPTTASAIEAAELVARRELAHQETSADDLAEGLSTPGRRVSASSVRDWLQRGRQDGLLSRQRLTLATGGARYLYRMRAPVVAYLADTDLARQLSESFARTVF